MINDLSIVIPAYNEAAVIREVLSALIAYNPRLEIIVVDDGSRDETCAICREMNVKLIRHNDNLGYGAALKTGIRSASNENILIMDGDGQHRNLGDIERLYNYIQDYDMIVGARSKGHSQQFVRKIGKFIMNKVAAYLAEKDIPDINSGFRILKKSIIEKYFPLLCNEFSFTTTTTLIMYKEGYRIKYVPIQVSKRNGKSTVKLFRHGLGSLLFILRTIMLFNPLKVFLPISFVLFSLGFLRLMLAAIFDLNYTATATIGIVSGIMIFMFGLLADQIASIRRETLRKA